MKIETFCITIANYILTWLDLEGKHLTAVLKKREQTVSDFKLLLIIVLD